MRRYLPDNLDFFFLSKTFLLILHSSQLTAPRTLSLPLQDTEAVPYKFLTHQSKLIYIILAIMRTAPNIIITGTPGVGKTIHSEQVAQDTGLQHMSINDIAKQRDCYDGYDEERQSWIIDEDKVCSQPHFIPLLRLLFLLTFC